MLTLLTIGPALGVLSPSPFCLKADTLLAMSGLAYARKPGSFIKAPRGKLPVLADGGTLVTDSEAIRRYLRAAKGFDADASLDADQAAEALAWRTLIEEQLYFLMVWSRWIDRPEAIEAPFFGAMPLPVRKAVFTFARSKIRRDLNGQGAGRRDAAERRAMGEEIVAAVARRLGGRPFVFGETPTALDATIFGAFENLIAVELDGPLEQAARSHAALSGHCARMRERFHGEGAA